MSEAVPRTTKKCTCLLLAPANRWRGTLTGFSQSTGGVLVLPRQHRLPGCLKVLFSQVVIDIACRSVEVAAAASVTQSATLEARIS
jgi:hypothetical protein